MALHTLTLYGKKDCCLCDDAKVVLDRVRRSIPFHLEIIDITSDPSLFERYSIDIPVLCIDGIMVFRHGVHEKKLRQLLSR